MATSLETKVLTSNVLSKYLLDRSDRTALTKAFVASQKQHASAYAIEGKKLASRWNNNVGSDINSQTAPEKNTTPVGGGFSSPVLKPRNATCPSAVLRSSCTPSVDIPPTREESARKAPVRSKERSPSPAQPDKVSNKGSKKSNPGLQETKLGKGKLKLSTESKRTKRKRSDSDDDREERLAQRRARRQHKKDIIAPKARSEKHVSDSEGETDKPSASEGKKTKTKDSKNKLPAGLALMHGFSAGNIGKHRLTIGPAATFGVFNKGRASTKTKVGKKSKLKAPVTFDELCFLSKVARSFTTSSSVSKYFPKCANSTGSDQSRALSSSQGESSHRQNHVTETKTSALRSKASLEDLLSKKEHSDCDDKSNFESEVWEIEKEFLHDTDDDQGSASLAKPRSVVINSRAWDWGVAEASGQVNDIARASIGGDDDHENGSAVNSSCHFGTITSLAPSQSASQVPVRLPVLSDALQLKSKFFASPKEDEGDEEVLLTGQRNVSPPPEQDPAHHGQIEGNTDNALFDRDQEVDIGCEAPIQHQVSECRSINASSCSLERAIRKLEASDQGALATQYDVLPRCPRLSVLGSDFAFEDDHGTAPIPQYETEFTNLDVTDTRTDSRMDQHLYGSFNSYDMVHAYSEAAHTEYDDLKHYENGGDQNIHDQVLDESGSGFDDIYLPGEAQGGDYNYANSVYSMDLDYESSVDEDSYDHFNPQNPFEYDPEDDYGSLCVSDDCEGSSYSHQSDMTCDEDYYLGHSGEIQEGGQLDDLGTGMPEISFLQGRTMLFGANNLEGQFNSMNRSTPAKASRHLGSLKDAEAAVAKDFQKSFYPIKF